MARRAITKPVTKPKAKTNQRPQAIPTKRWEKLASSPPFAKRYMLLSVATLLATTVFWALQSARVQLGNADQLVSPYLFEHTNTLRGALFPGAHSFLLKWPLFWLIKLLGFTSLDYIVVTVGLVLVTIGGLAFIIYRIERRPLVFGTLCLALASSLLLVPAQPYAGAILPVNMAMIATRNLEYLLYIASLILLIRSPRIRSWRFWVAISCLGLLVASDKLFLTISLGGALLALVAYALNRGWGLASLSARWFLASLGAAASAVGLLWLLQASRLTHIAGQAGAGPYGLVKGVHDVVLGTIYAVLGLFTSFGANPVYDVTVLHKLPHQLLARWHSLASVAFAINALLLLGGLYLAWRLLHFSLTHHKRENSRLDTASTLSVVLLWASLAAVASFIATNHYYAVDARYLSIVLFAVFIAAATALSQRQWQPTKVLLAGGVILISILVGLLSANQTYHNERSALATVNGRNAFITQVLAHRQSEVLVGDYWRVIPIKYTASSRLNVMPLANCTQPRGALSSQAWQPDLHKHGFVYLLTLDGSLTNYPKCSLQQVVKFYGRPNASTLIAGSLSNPRELLLFYDHGIFKSAPTSKPLPQGPSTVVPVSLEQLASLTPPSCNTPTIMTIVAHQDDDLLFMNPDLLHDIRAGHCIRTIYVTAGDSGSSKFYWLSREQGSHAAYSSMTPEKDDIWVQRIVQLSKHEFVTIASPRGNPKISLIFMHLPDGNLQGQGFKASRDESLAKLEAGKINIIHAVDNQSVYSSGQLTTALTSLMHFYQPSEIRTQANYISQKYPDHSDHLAVGRYVQRAYHQYELQQYEDAVRIPLKFYIGYPVHAFPPNVFGKDLQESDAAYFDYARFDKAACQTQHDCESKSTFGLYLQRQYQNPY